MPIRNGRWVPFSVIAAEKAAEPKPPPPEPKSDHPKPKRRSKWAAETAIFEATGLEIKLEE